MKGPSRPRLARIGIAVALAVVLGSLAPSLSASIPASAATDGQMVVPASGNIQSKVGDGCVGNYRAHDGIDISAPSGAPIIAAYDGVVKSRTVNSGYGNYTDIEHAGGYVTRYAHMASPGIYAPGTRVVRGQQIGVIGNTGNSPAYHLHFEVRLNGAVYAAINGGFVCLSNVVRGNAIPLVFPGLRTATVPLPPVADFTGDGKADLLVVAGNGDLQLRPGAGNGTFPSSTTISSGWGNSRRHVTHADFNGDGRGDILAARYDGPLEYYAGNGAGGFTLISEVGNAWYEQLHVTSGADYTGDGKQDVIAVSPSGFLTIYQGNGAGGFGTAHQTIGGGWAGFHFLVGGDFDNDGYGDLMAITDLGELYFYPGVPYGFAPGRRVGGGWMEFTALTGGVDYNGDGRADLLGRTPSGELYFYPGLGNGTVGDRTRIGTTWGELLTLE